MRPPSQGDNAIALDAQRLTSILRRVMPDPKREGARPLQGTAAIAIDAQRISGILRRVALDPYRTDKQKKEIADALKRVMALLLDKPEKAKTKRQREEIADLLRTVMKLLLLRSTSKLAHTG